MGKGVKDVIVCRIIIYCRAQTYFRNLILDTSFARLSMLVNLFQRACYITCVHRHRKVLLLNIQKST